MSRFRDFESKPQSLSNRQHHDSPIFDFDSSVKISDGLEVLLIYSYWAQLTHLETQLIIMFETTEKTPNKELL